MRQFRLLVTTYHTQASQEDGPGSLTNVDQTSSAPSVAWEDEMEHEPTAQELAMMGVDFSPDPYGETEENYELEEKIDGQWERCAFIDPPEIKDEPVDDDDEEEEGFDWDRLVQSWE